ncbi:MAG: hypothetical protein IKN05_01450 [Clostridia bacterium]|nr:hypothetical protein [Clostridia bacterium]
MKKLLACLLALAIFALPALAEPRSYLDYTDDILEDGSPIYYFMELSLKLPAEWRGKVFAMAEDSGVGFYQRASYDAFQADGLDGGGFLFRLGCSVNHSFDQLPSFRYLGFSEESALNYYLELPSDYRAYGGDEARAEYDAMFAQIDDVVENAAFYADQTQPEPQAQAQDDSAAQGVTLEQARYHFEHNALPRYFYDDPANVIDVLSQNGVYRLWKAFADENGIAYPYTAEDCHEVLFSADDGATVLLLLLPKPEANTLCYRIYMVHKPSSGAAGYYTVEYDNLLGDDAFLCGRSAEHEHANYGGAWSTGRALAGDELELLAEAQQVAALAGVSTALTRAESAGPTGGETDNLALIECPQLGFSTMADPALTWEYEEGTGVYIYAETAGSIPYAIVYRTGDVIAEPMEYIREQFTPHMQQQYGEDLIAVNELEDYQIGGKHLPAGLYTYLVQGHLIDMLRLYDVSERGTAIYTAKYVDAHGEATLKILDTAIRTYSAE